MDGAQAGTEAAFDLILKSVEMTGRKLGIKKRVRKPKRRLGWITPSNGGHFWTIILSNGRKLCECPTRSAAERIYKALENKS